MKLSELTSWLKSFHDYVSKIRCFQEFIRANKNDARICTSKLLQMFTNVTFGINELKSIVFIKKHYQIE